MQCPKCGYALSAFDKDCPRCATNQKVTTPVVTPNPTITPKPTPPSPAPSSPTPVVVHPQGKTFIDHIGEFVIFTLVVGFLCWQFPPINNFVGNIGAAIMSIFSSREDLEVSVKREVNNTLSAEGHQVTCESLTLVQESGNNYTGVITYSDGTTGNLHVTVDSTGRMVYRFVRPSH